MKDLVDILKAVPQEEIKRKREAVLALRRRFNWQSAVKKVHASKHLPVINATGRTREQVDFTGYDGRQDDPAVRPDATGSAEDTPMPFLPDAFGTIMEILAFKASANPNLQFLSLSLSSLCLAGSRLRFVCFVAARVCGTWRGAVLIMYCVRFFLLSFRARRL